MCTYHLGFLCTPTRGCNSPEFACYRPVAKNENSCICVRCVETRGGATACGCVQSRMLYSILASHFFYSSIYNWGGWSFCVFIPTDACFARARFYVEPVAPSFSSPWRRVLENIRILLEVRCYRGSYLFIDCWIPIVILLNKWIYIYFFSHVTFVCIYLQIIGLESRDGFIYWQGMNL